MHKTSLLCVAIFGSLGWGGCTAEHDDPSGAPEDTPGELPESWLPTAPGQRTPAAELIDQLKAIPGMTVDMELPAPAGFRLFSLRYRQPVHHWDRSQGTFEQRLTLLSRDVAAPVVLVSTGYSIDISAGRSEPTRLVNGNQVTVEHRFFSPSRPSPADWKRLNIQQAAADHHRIVSALKSIYSGPWISTGASKGGMTSVYHRRFYPKDMAATIAYVAPHDNDQITDAHTKFLDSVGTDPACRAALKQAQRQMLVQRNEMVAQLDSYAAEHNVHFVDSASHSLEVMVVEMPFIFWQYGGQSGCSTVPTDGAGATELFRFLDDVVGVYSYTHEDADGYIPYYYQAGTQLGYPVVATDYLNDLLTFSDVQEPSFYVPADVPVTYRAAAMRDVGSWVKTKAERIMLIYGEYDPWSAEPFEFGSGTKDSVRYIVPRGNHGAILARLPAAQRDEATAKLRTWVGLPRAVDEREFAPNELDAIDPLMVRRPRL